MAHVILSCLVAAFFAAPPFATIAQVPQPGEDRTWIPVGATVGLKPNEFLKVFRASMDSFVIESDWSGHVLQLDAPRGHLWEIRTLLKKAALKNHFEILLAPWPIGSKGDWILWGKGGRVSHFRDEPAPGW